MCSEHPEKLSVRLEPGDGCGLARINRFIRVEADLRQTHEADKGSGRGDQDECNRSCDPAGRDESIDPITSAAMEGATGCDRVELDRGSRDGGHTCASAGVAGWLGSLLRLGDRLLSGSIHV